MVKSTMTETCSAVLRSRRNCSSDGAKRTDDGRAFHARAAVTEKARSPSVVRRVDGMTSVDLEVLRRRRRKRTSAVEWRVSARYDGAVPIRQRYARTQAKLGVNNGSGDGGSCFGIEAWTDTAKRFLISNIFTTYCGNICKVWRDF